jgi:hypothetical protein
MRTVRAVRAYRVLTLLYPRRFRRDYRVPMVQLFTDRVRRDGTRRAWGGALRDLAVSAPNQYWESFMNANPQTKLIAGAVATAVAAMAVLLVGGALMGMVLLLALAWQLYAILHTRGHRFSARTWWHFVAGGAGVFATLFVIFALPWPEDWRAVVPGELAWSVAMLGFSTSIVLVLVGASIGLAQLASRRRPSV